MKILLMILCACAGFRAAGQRFQVSPMHPVGSQMISIKYFDSAKIFLSDSMLYARSEVMFYDATTQRVIIPLYRSLNHQFVGTYRIPNQASALQLQVYSLNSEADNGSAVVKVYDSLKQKPAPGAEMAFHYLGDVNKNFNTEVKRYPSHYLAYGQLFNLLSFQQNDSAKALIKHYIVKLEARFASNLSPSGDLLAALCVGYAKSDQLEKASRFMHRLLDQFPESGCTAFAFRFYEYEKYKSGISAVDQSMRAKAKNIFIQFPKAPLSQELAILALLGTDTSIPLENFISAYKLLLEQNPMNHWYFSFLIDIYIKRNDRIGEAEKMLLEFLEKAQRGEINHYYRIPAARYNAAVGVIYKQLAKIALMQGEYVKSALFCGASLHHADEMIHTQELLRTRARAHYLSGNTSMALNDYEQLFELGDTSIVDPLQEVYGLVHPGQDFSSYLISKKGKPLNIKSRTLAPVFSVKDLDGNVIRYDSLRGKVVVLNFWGIGCGPCIREMPDLNKVVEKYAANKEVIFLAVTGDTRTELQHFLNRRKFDYTVVNEGNDIWKDYNITVQPTHIVIDKNGKIITRIVGALEGIDLMLAGWIEKAL